MISRSVRRLAINSSSSFDPTLLMVWMSASVAATCFCNTCRSLLDILAVNVGKQCQRDKTENVVLITPVSHVVTLLELDLWVAQVKIQKCRHVASLLDSRGRRLWTRVSHEFVGRDGHERHGESLRIKLRDEVLDKGIHTIRWGRSHSHNQLRVGTFDHYLLSCSSHHTLLCNLISFLFSWLVSPNKTVAAKKPGPSGNFRVRVLLPSIASSKVVFQRFVLILRGMNCNCIYDAPLSILFLFSGMVITSKSIRTSVRS